MARENTSWGYTRICGALANMGHEVGRNTVKRILAEHGIEPAPARAKRTPCTFPKAHWGAVAATDFFTVEVLTARGLIRYFVLLLIGICISSGCELGRSFSYDMDIRPFGEHLHGKSRSAAGGAKLVKCVSWVRDTRGVSIQVGRLVDGDLGGLGRSSRSSFALEMIQDASDDRRLGNEGDDFHLFSASTTGQRVDLVDTVDELGPSLTQSTSSRENIVLFFLLLFHGVTASDLF